MNKAVEMPEMADPEKKAPRARSVRKDKFIYPCELSEEQISIKIGFHFGLLEAVLGKQFDLLDSDEGRTGADHEYQGVSARYYLQAKSPIALLSSKTVPIARGKADAGYNAIRTFREKAGLRDEPYSLSFGLRAPAKHAKVPDELQHNLLLKMHSPGNGSKAMYVAPTVYEKERYMSLLRDQTNWREMHYRPFWHDELRRITIAHAAHIFISCPFLQAHICIVPHASVDTHEHYYSYSSLGNDVAFHSPASLPNAGIDLSDMLSQEVTRIGADDDSTTPLAVASENLRRILPDSIRSNVGIPGEGTYVKWFAHVGRLLKEQYQIDQYVVLKKV